MAERSKKPRCAPKPDDSWIRVLEEREAAGLILDGMRDGILLNTVAGVVLHINRSMADMLGMDAEKAAGKRMDELFGEEIRKFCVEPGGGVEAEAGRRTWSLKGRDYEVDCVALPCEKNGERMELTVLHEVTGKRSLERQRSHILSMVSHDVRAPLTTILGYCELLLDGNMGEISGDAEEAVAAMMRSGKKILGIIEDFLIAAKTDAGMTKPSFRPVDLVETCRHLVDSISPDVSRVNRSLVFEPDGKSLTVECDPKLIERVVMNLLDNAVKYSNARGTIRLRVCPSVGDKVEIVVKDDGVGIPKKELPHVFERYWRGRGVGEIKGSGLGLSIVKQLVEMHGGAIIIDSKRGAGTTVRVQIPLVQPG